MHADFDFGLLYDMTGGDAQIVSNLLVVIKKNLIEYPSAIKQFFDNNDLEIMCKQAHKFKSSIAYLGFDKFSESLSQIELSLEENKPAEQIAAAINQMERYAKETLQEVEEELVRLATMG